MWQKFVRTDYMDQAVPEHSKLKAIMGNPEEKKKHQKVQREWAKIKALDQQLSETNRAYKQNKQESQQRERELKLREMQEEEERRRKHRERRASYLRQGSGRSRKSSAGSRKSSAGSSRRKGSKKGFRKNPFTKKEEEKDTGTFLTGIKNGANLLKIDEQIMDQLEYVPGPLQNDSEMQAILDRESAQRMAVHKENMSKNEEAVVRTHTSVCERLTDDQKDRLKALESDIEETFKDVDPQKILAIRDRPENERLELMADVMGVTEAGESGVTGGLKNAYQYEET